MTAWLQQVLWGWPVLLAIFLVGLLLSLRTGFFQLRKAGFWLKTALTPQSRGKTGVSPFQALTTALAGSIGTGNIVGVAAALTSGGPGALFWMWISALLGMTTIFGENLLAAKFPQASGALGYIEKVKKIGKPLAYLYAAGAFLSALAMGNMVQTNAATAAFASFGVPPLITAAGFAVVLFFVAGGGLKSAVKITEKLVPAMTLLFFAAALAVLWLFRDNLSNAFRLIFQEAFSLKAGAGGTAGMLIAAKTGISRGIFTNEAGLGSSAFAYEEVKGRTPVQLGCMGIVQVLVDTLLMCTVTGLCILCAPANGQTGASLTFSAFEAALGPAGGKAISLCTALFAFATTVAWCCYGRAGFFYLTKGRGRFGYALFFAAAAFCGCLIPLSTAFEIGDAFNGLMAIPNVIALTVFSGTIAREVKNGTAKPPAQLRQTKH